MDENSETWGNEKTIPGNQREGREKASCGHAVNKKKKKRKTIDQHGGKKNPATDSPREINW